MTEQPHHIIGSTSQLAGSQPQSETVRHIIGSGTHTSTVLFTGPVGPARAHVHRHHDEVCVLLMGRGTVTVDGVTEEVAQGDVVVIPAGAPHSANFEEPFRMVSVYGPTDDPDAPDREWV